MFKKILFVTFLLITALSAQDTAYIKTAGEQISIGNKYIERVIASLPKK